MELAPTTKDLQMAIMELDILYEDLTQQRNNVKVQSTNVQDYCPSPSYSREQGFISQNVEDDYDVPRPAESVFNSPILNATDNEDPKRHRSISFKSEAFLPCRNEDGDYTNRPSEVTRSPALSVDSKSSSSGIGTLRISSTVAADVHSPNYDSDYDEVASINGDESDPKYSYPVKRPRTIHTFQWSPKHQGSELVSSSQDDVLTDPDYDEVCSNGSHNDVHYPAWNTHTVDYRTHENGELLKAVNESPRRENPTRQNALPDTVEDLKQIPIEYDDEEVRNGSSHISHLSEVVVEAPCRSFPDSDSFQRKQSDMTAKISDQKDDDDDCPCECPSAVPLMSCAVIICVALLIFAAIAYIYFGIRIDKWSRTEATPAIDTSNGLK